MSNLLKDASILLTPTGYDNGRMNAIKPSKDLYGPELVTNGDFATDSDWTKGTGWSIANGKASRTAQSGSTACDQNISITAGRTYKIVYDLTITSGSFFVRLAGTTNVSGTSRTTSGTYTDYLTAATGNNKIRLVGEDGSFVGSIDNVSVVEDLSGDFQFERNSAATRVNAQGLVENVQIISPELVSNGNFSQIGTEEVLNGNFSQEGSQLVTNGSFDTDSDWNGTNTNGVTISNGSLNYSDTTLNHNVSQGSVVTIGKSYKVTLTVSNYVKGSVLIIVGAGGSLQEVSSNGTFTMYGVASINTTFYFQARGTNGTSLSIDNVSVKEVGQNWTIENTWTIGDGVANGNGANLSTEELVQANVNTIGKTYKATFEVLNYVSGSVGFWKGSGIALTQRNANGTYTEYFTATSEQIRFRGSNFNGSITNISVKEVGQDWTLGSGWSIGEDKAISDGSGFGALSSSYSNFNSKKLKVNFDILNYVSGEIRVPPSYRQDGLDIRYSANGSYELIYDSINSAFALNTVNFNGSATNISVKEITDDTNIPRINYEGFSYQDSLGSEEIVNGDFSNGLTNWTNNSSWWSIVNGEAYHPASTSMKPLSQSVSTEVGKEYKISVNVNIVSGTPQVFWDKVSGQEAQSLSQGLNEVIVTTFKTNSSIYFGRVPSTNTEFYIDNVSVKEYLGQEVVPDSGCGSWLLEPQSTNLITYSSDFSQSNWLNFQSAITSSQINTLTNNDDATLFYPLYSSTYASLYDPSNLSLGIYTFSVFAKASGKDFLCIDDTFGGKNWFNLGNGTLGTINSSYTGNIQDFGNGWYRCSVTNNSDATFNYKVVYAVTDADNSTTITQNGIDGILLFGSQTEQQSYATSYIPTNGAANTRLQDIADNSGNASLISSPEGVLYAEIAAFVNSGATRYLGLNDGSSSNRVVILYDGTLNRIRAIVSSGGTKYADLYYSVTDVTDFHKVAVKYKANDFALWIDGVERVTETSGSAPIGLNDLDFELSGSPFYGKTKALAVYKEALTNANLRSLTYPNPVATTFDLDFDTIAEQFTFTRGSEATFVNEQGLIESTNQIGPELVTNGDFATDSDWTKGTGWSIENGIATLDGTQTSGSSLGSNIMSVVSGKTYKIVVNVLSTSSGFRLYDSDGVLDYSLSVGENVFYKTVSSSSYQVTPLGLSGTIGSIDNVSVKEVISATNTPRIDYSTGEKAFLLEPQSTNLIPYSEDFSQWNNVSATLTPNQLSPDGQNSAYIIEDSSVSSFERIDKTITTNATPHTFSVFIKKKTSAVSSYSGIQMGTGFSYVIFDSYNGTYNTSLAANYDSIEVVDFNSDWWVLKLTATVTTSTRVGLWGAISEDGINISISATGSETFFGAQLEQQSYATSYIPTSGASATRNQELCADATPVINSEEGVLYAEVAGLSNGGVDRSISLSDNSTNYLRITLHANSNRIAFFSSTGVNYNNYDFSQTSDLKIAFQYKENDWKIYINGTLKGTNTSASTFSPNTLSDLSFDLVSNNPFFGNTKDLKYYPKALADVQLEDLTTI